MKVILTEDVVGLGDIGEVTTVRPGYARNYLVPRGLAVEWGTSSSKQIAHQMKQIEAKKRRLKKGCEEVAAKIRDLAFTFDVRVGTGGKVFGSITQKDIAEKLKLNGFEVDRKRVLLTEPLKKIGTHFVKIKLHPEVEALLKVTMNPIEATKEEEAQETKEARETIETAAAERDDERNAE